MDIVQKLIAKFENNGVVYKKYEHEPVITSHDAARVRNTDISTGIKALIFIADGRPVMLAVPGDRKIDTSKFKKLFDVKDLRMANSSELFEITKLNKGAVPPLGSIFKIPTYYDSSIRKLEMVVFNAGSREISIQVKSEDLTDVEKTIWGDFSKING